MSVIRLYTKSGWYYDAAKESDPYFGYLLSGMDLDETITEIELPGVVGEIIDVEWSHYLRMRRMDERLRENIDSGSDRISTCILSDIVYLADIVRIINIVDMPPRWEYLVSVDARTPREDRISHLRRVGGIVSQSEFLLQHLHFDPQTRYANPTEELLRLLFIDAHPNLYEYDLDSDYIQYILGIIVNRNRRIIHDHGRTMGSNLIYQGVFWDDIRSALVIIGEETGIKSEIPSSLLAAIDLVTRNDTRTKKGVEKEYALKCLSTLHRYLTHYRDHRYTVQGAGISLSESRRLRNGG